MLNSLQKLLSIIKNGQNNNLLIVTCQETKIAIQVLNVLQENGFILGYRFKNRQKNIIPTAANSNYSKNYEIEILLKYNKDKPVIKSCQLISKPSNKVYKSIQELQSMQRNKIISPPSGKVNPLADDGIIKNDKYYKKISRELTQGEKNWKSLINGMYILTTTKGIISDKTALKYNISGQVLCKIN